MNNFKVGEKLMIRDNDDILNGHIGTCMGCDYIYNTVFLNILGHEIEINERYLIRIGEENEKKNI